MKRFLLLLALLLALPCTAAPGDAVLEQVGFDQRLQAQLPLQRSFTDSHGRSLRLRELFGEQPVILALVWYQCPNLCGVTLRGMMNALEQVDLAPGKDFQVVAIDLSPGTDPELMASLKAELLGGYDRPGAADALHLLSGEQQDVDAVASAIGFRYTYDPEKEQYAHPAGLTFLTPDGRVSSYLFGVTFPAQDLRLATVQAGQGRSGSLVDQVLLRCYAYDPQSGQYSLAVLQLMRAGGTATALLIAGLVAGHIWRERRRRRRS